MKILNEKGYIQIPRPVIAVIAGYAALNCYGVKCMTASGLDDIVYLLRGASFPKGVKVTLEGSFADIDLHVAMIYGVNMPAVAQSIMNEVKYVVERQTGITVRHVNVFVETVLPDR